MHIEVPPPPGPWVQSTSKDDPDYGLAHDLISCLLHGPVCSTVKDNYYVIGVFSDSPPPPLPPFSLSLFLPFSSGVAVWKERPPLLPRPIMASLIILVLHRRTAHGAGGGGGFK